MRNSADPKEALSRALLLALLPSLAAGCSTKFVVKSEPSQAEVYVKVPGRTGDDRKSLGKTPLELSPSEVRDIAGEELLSGQYLDITVEKPDYQPERLAVPATRFGTMVTELDVKLKPGEAEERVAVEIIQGLMTAQRAATNKEFDRANVELDKILSKYPRFTRALAMKGAIFFVRKDYDESRRWYEKALLTDPQDRDAIDMVTRIKDLKEGRRSPAAEKSSGATGGGTAAQTPKSGEAPVAPSSPKQAIPKGR